MYARHYNNNDSLMFLEWVPFDKFTDVKQIGEGGFAKVYSAIWIDGNVIKQINEKSAPEPIVIALKRLNGSQNISAEYLNEVYYYIHFHFACLRIFIKFLL